VTVNVLLPSASAVGILIAALARVVWLVVTGRLVPHGQLDDVRADRDKQLARADAEVARWRSAYEYSEQARRIDAGHTGQILANVTAVAAALPAPAGEPAGGSDAAAVA
jgi:hypothetical protein